jgi:hypothetical protein
MMFCANNQVMPVAGWWWFSRCENQCRVQQRNALFGRFLALGPPANTRAEFSQRENYYHF